MKLEKIWLFHFSGAKAMRILRKFVTTYKYQTDVFMNSLALNKKGNKLEHIDEELLRWGKQGLS